MPTQSPSPTLFFGGVYNLLLLLIMTLSLYCFSHSTPQAEAWKFQRVKSCVVPCSRRHQQVSGRFQTEVTCARRIGREVQLEKVQRSLKEKGNFLVALIWSLLNRRAKVCICPSGCSTGLFLQVTARMAQISLQGSQVCSCGKRHGSKQRSVGHIQRHVEP